MPKGSLVGNAGKWDRSHMAQRRACLICSQEALHSGSILPPHCRVRTVLRRIRNRMVQSQHPQWKHYLCIAQCPLRSVLLAVLKHQASLMCVHYKFMSS